MKIITFYNLFLLLKKSGFKNLLKKIKSCIKELVSDAANSDVTAYLAVHFSKLRPISWRRTSDGIKRINLIIDSIAKESFFGGVATVLIISAEISNRFCLPLRIITRLNNTNPVYFYDILDLNKIQRPEQLSFYCYTDQKNPGLDISPTDIFIAASWWNAFVLKKSTAVTRFFYIIQEVETFFYPHGVDHYLCSTIMNDKNIDFIVNSGYLFEYFREYFPNIHNHGIAFEPAFPVFKAGNFGKKDKYKMFFYARPNNPRNLFLYGVYILDKCISSGVLDTKEWDIFFLGHDIPDLRFSDGSRPVIAGILDWKNYSEFLSDVDLALSLMYTPHPSYPPFDAAASGAVVISNKCLNKTEFPFSKNVILSDLEENIFLQNMRDAVNLAKDTEKRKKNYESSTIPRSWTENLNSVIEYVKEKA
jgi:hypothetical protein